MKHIESLLPKGVHRYVDMWEKLQYVEVPKKSERTGRIAELVRGKSLDSLSISVTVAYAVFCWFSTNADWTSMWEKSRNPVTFWAADFAFLCFYTVEIGLKLFVYGRWFFTNKYRAWHWFDLLLVVVSIAEQFILLHAQLNLAWSSVEAPPRLLYLRALRALRIVKVLRIFRSLAYFQEMRLMLLMVAGSVVSLFWCMVMILCTLYIWSILIMQLLLLNLESSVNSDSTSDVHMISLNQMFSTVRRTSITLFQATTGGTDWATVYDLLSPHGGLLSLVFLSCIVFFVLVTWNIVTSTFVQKAVSLAQPDPDSLMYDQLRDKMLISKELDDLFSELSTNDSRSISWNELRNLEKKAELRNWLEARNINVKDVTQFCELVQELNNRGRGIIMIIMIIIIIIIMIIHMIITIMIKSPPPVNKDPPLGHCMCYFD